MKTMPSALVPFLRSEVQGAILAEIFLGNGEHTISSLAKAVGTSQPTAMREVDRLVEAGYVTDRHIGRARVITSNTQHPLFRPLQEIVRYSYGPVPILHSLLANRPEIQDALIFGSWAERASGVPGHDPSDIDVLIIGDMRPRAAAVLANEASDLIGKEVNIMTTSPEEWRSKEDGLLREIASRPTINLNTNKGLEAA